MSVCQKHLSILCQFKLEDICIGTGLETFAIYSLFIASLHRQLQRFKVGAEFILPNGKVIQ